VGSNPTGGTKSKIDIINDALHRIERSEPLYVGQELAAELEILSIFDEMRRILDEPRG